MANDGFFSHWGDLYQPWKAFGNLFGGGGGKKQSSAPASIDQFGVPSQTQYRSPLDEIQSFMQQYQTGGQTPQQVYSFLSQQDPQHLKNQSSLEKALQSYAQYSQWSPAGQQGSSSASVIDPLAVQSFFNTTISPYLKEIGAQEKATAAQLGNSSTAGLPKEYAAIIGAGNQRQAQDMNMMYEATQAAAAEQPRVDQLMQMLGLVQKAKLQDYYRSLAGQTSQAAYVPPK